MSDSAASLAEFIDHDEVRDRSLAVVNRTRPRPIQDMLESLFDGQAVDVEERDLPDAAADTVVLLEDGDVVASSPLEAIEDEILLVNSDLYTTGAKSLTDVSPPAVLTALEGTPFRLRGYPESNTEKLPLIVVSRYIERLAWRQGTGRLRASFQRLSRLDDERGTGEVYRTLAGTPVDVHVYGVPDWIPPDPFSGVVHGGYHGEFRTSWFVIFHADDPDVRTAALIAEEVEPNVWEALWTFRPERVDAVNRYVEREL
jgi:hypothetical protein